MQNGIISYTGIITSLLVFFLAPLVNAQNFARNWTMSFQTTLTFQGNGISTSSNASIVGYNATIISANDRNGDLLFFSSGQALYHNGQAVMPNGDSIFNLNQFGNVYLPALDDTNKFYVFVNGDPDNFNDLKIRSSAIDMSLNGGLGDVIGAEKNQVLITDPLGFGLTATAHRDGQRAWIAVVLQDENLFKLLLIGNGVESIVTSPSYIGNDSTIIPISYALRFSPNGKYLAFANSYNGENALLIYSFNNATGELKFLHRVSEADGASAASSMEFSSDSRFLYFTLNSSGSSNNANLFQLEMGTSWDIHLIDSFPVWPRMQLDPARRILLGYQSQNIAAILNPNDSFDSLEIVDSIATFEPQFIDSWFPNYISNWFNTSYCVGNLCYGDTTQFYFAGYRMDSAIWNFGDPISGNANIASGLEVGHQFSDTGIFEVTLYATTGEQTDTIIKSVDISMPIESDFIKSTDTSVCRGDTIELIPHQPSPSYLWNDNVFSSERTFDSSGVYYLTVSNSCNQSVDSITIAVDTALPAFNLMDVAVCADVKMTVSLVDSSGIQFLWSTGDTTTNITLDSSLNPDLSPVDIWLIASNACGSDSDTMTLSFIPLPDASLPSDSVQCYNAPVTVVRSDQDSTTYAWFDGSNNLVKFIEQDTIIWLSATNVCGSDTDSMQIRFHPEIIVELGEDTFLCEGDSVVLDASWQGATYTWTPGGSTDSTLTVSFEELEGIGEDVYVVTITEGPCTLIESKKVSIVEEQCDTVACKFDIPNVFTPNGDGINDVLRISNRCKTLSFQVSIFNRWGQLVFQANSSLSQWDGAINGESASEGTYFIVVEQNEHSTQRTSVTLLR